MVGQDPDTPLLACAGDAFTFHILAVFLSEFEQLRRLALQRSLPPARSAAKINRGMSTT
jgi:hypothetical protein